jgi:hypothetical protein
MIPLTILVLFPIRSRARAAFQGAGTYSGHCACFDFSGRHGACPGCRSWAAFRRHRLDIYRPAGGPFRGAFARPRLAARATRPAGAMEGRMDSRSIPLRTLIE